MWGRSSAKLARISVIDVRVLTESEQFSPRCSEFSPTVILLDLQMPDRDGIELLRELSTLERNPKILIASGLDSRVLTTASELGISMGLDIAGSFCKPIALDELEVLLVRLKSHEKVITASQVREGLALRGSSSFTICPKPRSRVPAGGSSRAPRPSCVGSTPSTACSTRKTSSKSPKTAVPSRNSPISCSARAWSRRACGSPTVFTWSSASTCRPSFSAISSSRIVC